MVILRVQNASAVQIKDLKIIKVLLLGILDKKHGTKKMFFVSYELLHTLPVEG